jgi:hypothetical protein
MRLYGIALFIHMLGLIALFASFAMQQRVGAKLRATVGQDEARHWSGLLDATRPMAPSGAVMTLLSGAWMTWAQWRQMPTFVLVGLGAVAFIGVAMTLVGARFAAIHRAMALDPPRESATAPPGPRSAQRTAPGWAPCGSCPSSRE